MAPEYAMHGQYSEKTDVLSFGVLVLEIVSGRKIGSIQHGEDTGDLLSYVSVSFSFHLSSLLLEL